MQIHSIDYKHKLFNDVLEIEWLLGNTCNYKCSYCIDELRSGSHAWANIDSAKKFVDKVITHYSQIGIRNYIWKFGGGEPLMYGDFITLCEYINSKKNSIVIVASNAAASKDYWRTYGKNFFAAHFSVHPEYADGRHISAVCDMLTDMGVEVTCHVMMMPTLYEKCLALIDLLKLSRRKEWGIQAKPLFHTWETDTSSLRQLYSYTDEQKIIFNKSVREQKRLDGENADLDRSMIAVTDQGEQSFDAYWAVTNRIVDWRGYRCWIGVNRIYINYDQTLKLGAGCYMDYKNFVGKRIDDDDIIFPNKPTKCTQESCVCIADVQVPKSR